MLQELGLQEPTQGLRIMVPGHCSPKDMYSENAWRLKARPGKCGRHGSALGQKGNLPLNLICFKGTGGNKQKTCLDLLCCQERLG